MTPAVALHSRRPPSSSVAVVPSIFGAAPAAKTLPEADGLIASPEPECPVARSAAGWPLRRNGVAADVARRRAELLWKVAGLGTGWSSPIAVGQQLITGDVGDDLVIFASIATDNSSGARTPSLEGSLPRRGPAVRFAGRLYHLNAHGRVACVEAATGQEVWAVEVLERFAAENITVPPANACSMDGPGDRHARRDEGPDGRPGQAHRGNGLDDGAAGRTAPTHSSPILLVRPPADCPLLGPARLRRRRRQRAAAVDRAAEQPLRSEHGDADLRRRLRVLSVTPYAEHGPAVSPAGRPRASHGELVWTHPLDTVTGSGVFLDDTLFAAGYRKNKLWLAIDWRTGQTKHQLKDLTTVAAIHADGRLYVSWTDPARRGCSSRRRRLTVAGQSPPGHQAGARRCGHPVLHDGQFAPALPRPTVVLRRERPWQCEPSPLSLPPRSAETEGPVTRDQPAGAR